MADRGRPRTFDRNDALRRAMELFWAKGYEGASMAELTKAMGVSSPSLYAAFGSKDALFREAVALYEKSAGCEITSAMAAAPTARAAIGAYLAISAELLARPSQPPGCMIVLTAVNAEGASESTDQFLRSVRGSAAEALKMRLGEAVASGELPSGLDLSAIASFYVTVQQGMSIQARDGATPETLRSVARAAMAAWDGVVGSAVIRDACTTA